MLSKKQLRIILLHEFKLGRSAAEATQNIKQAWGEDVTESNVGKWFEKFSEGNTKVEEEHDETLEASEAEDVEKSKQQTTFEHNEKCLGSDGGEIPVEPKTKKTKTDSEFDIS